MTMMRDDFPTYPGSYNVVHVPIIHNAHDALMFRLTPKIRGDTSTIDLPRFISQVRIAMEIHIPGFRLPALVDISVGRRYGSMLDIHKRGKPYAGQSAVEIMNLINKKEIERVSAPVLVSDGNALVLKLQLQSIPTQEQAIQLKSLLSGYPGKNIVALNFVDADGSPQEIVIARYPTSLTVKDKDKFGIVLPCDIFVESAEDHLAFMAEAMGHVS
jgi:hypothetical protein